MRHFLPLLLALLFGTAALADAPCKDFAENLNLVHDSIVIGRLAAKTAGCVTRVTYRVDSGGRGARLEEVIGFDARNLPKSYAVTGQSEFGGAVDEHYAVSDGRAVWRSQADHGQGWGGGLYFADDGSPYALAVYARALLAAPDHRLSSLPAGSARIEKVGQQRLNSGPSSVEVDVYRIEGRSTWPDFVALDKDGGLFATIVDRDLLVRAGWERTEQAIIDTLMKASTAYAEQLQRTLAHPIVRPIHVRKVRIFNPETGTIGPLSEVTVVGGKIVAIGPGSASAPVAGDLTIDGAGGVLMPGLHDSHVHYNSLDQGLLYLAGGVTTIRDMGNNNDRLLQIVADIRAGKTAGPDIVYNGFIDGHSAYSHHVGFMADTQDAALADVRWYKQHGYFQIKLMSSIDAAWVPAIAGLAHAQGMGVTGHIPAFSTPDAMIDAGYDEIAHTSQLMLGWLTRPGEDMRTNLAHTAVQRAADLDLSSPPVLATIAHMQRRGTVLDTTLVIREQTMMARAGETPPSFATVVDHLPVGLSRDMRRTYYAIGSAAEDDRYKRAFRTAVDLVGILHDRGIRLLPGTDHGDAFALHRELELYVAAGIPPAEVLSDATLGMARYLKRDESHGTIAVGKAADMFLIADDPTRDISAVRRASIVFKGGYYYLPEEIYPALNIKPFAPRPAMSR